MAALKSMCVALVFFALVSVFADYDEQVSHKLSKLSAAGYCSWKLDSILNWNCPYSGDTPLQDVQVFASNGLGDEGSIFRASFGFAGRTENGDIYVAFRGTMNFAGWLADFSAWRVSYPGCAGCTIHAGFYASYLELAPSLHRALSALGAATAPRIFVTGYSLGGSLAIFAAYELHLAGLPVTDLYTFGSPRVGDAAYADAVASRFDGHSMQLSFSSESLNGASYSPFLTDALESALAAKEAEAAKLAAEAADAKVKEVQSVMAESLEALEAEVVANKTLMLTELADYAKLLKRNSAAPPRGAKSIVISFTGASSRKKQFDRYALFVPPQNEGTAQRFRAAAGGGAASGKGNAKQQVLAAHSVKAGGPVNSFRIVWRADMAPHVFIPELGFKHTGTEIWYDDYNDAGHYQTCTDAESPQTRCSAAQRRTSCDSPSKLDLLQCMEFVVKHTLSPLDDHLHYNIRGASDMFNVCL